MGLKPVFLLVLLAGCTVGPNYEEPSPWSPLSWFRQTPPKETVAKLSMPVADPVDPEWWNVLNDPVLTGLERRVADNNLDIRAANLRLAEARSQAGVTRADVYPTLNGNASYTRERLSPEGAISLLSGGSNPGTQSNGLGGTQGAIPTSSATSSKIPPSTCSKPGSTPPGSSTFGAGSAAKSRAPMPRWTPRRRRGGRRC